MMEFSLSVPATNASRVNRWHNHRQIVNLFLSQMCLNRFLWYVELIVARWVSLVASRADPQKILRSVGEELNVQDKRGRNLAVVAQT